MNSFPLSPNLENYEETYLNFSWADVLKELDGMQGGKGLNIAYEAVDRHAQGRLRNKTAICWTGDDEVREFTYGELREQTNRFANVLKFMNLKQGDRVCLLTGRVPELWIAALGIFKYGAVFCPLFSAFGPEPIYQRLSRSGAAVLVTTERIYKQKIAGIRDRLPELKYVFLIDTQDDAGKGIYSLSKYMEQASAEFSIVPSDFESPAILHFTSGTTGMPKAAVHVHKAVLVHYISGKYVLDIHPEDIFWCTADPGWVTGTSYGIIAPLLHGAACIIDGADFSAVRWLNILKKHKVNILYTSPSAIRRLMRVGEDLKKEYGLDSLRHVCSVGEPLGADAVVWGKKAFGKMIHDTWWQTETGGIMIANYPSSFIRPGSMGRPLPGIEAAIIRFGDDKHVEIVTEPDVTGYLALKRGWPSMFRGYLNDDARYRECFAEGWYITGDLAKRDSEGYYWFVGRGDDIIKTSGQMVGPFEVEQVLTAHTDVADAAVIGIPDPMFGEIVKAFVILKQGRAGDENMRESIMGFARKNLGPAISPKEIEFVDDLPKNKAGKTLRRVLKSREQGA